MIKPRKASATTEALLNTARELSASVARLKFPPPVAHIYNPLDYAWAAHELYVRRFATAPRRVIFLGMNPGPFGMMQTGVPFGEIAAVRDWMGITAPVTAPKRTHPKRPVEGFDCSRSEVSGRRLWGLFAQRFGKPERFFEEHFVVNYCPLAFLDEGGRNLTPDKFSASVGGKLLAACDEHLRRVVETLKPEWLVGVGDFAEKRARAALEGSNVRFGRILHPSPASPAANRGWAEAATRQMVEQGIWPAP